MRDQAEITVNALMLLDTLAIAARSISITCGIEM